MFRKDRYCDSREIVLGYFSRGTFIRCRCFYYGPRIRRLLAVLLLGHLSCHFCLRRSLDRSSVPGLRQSLLLPAVIVHQRRPLRRGPFSINPHGPTIAAKRTHENTYFAVKRHAGSYSKPTSFNPPTRSILHHT